eukprot:g374.t1
MPIDENATPMVAKVLGAQPDEVCIMNTLSVNLHLMFTTFYRPERNRRYKILYEQQAFPSDYFVFQSQAELHDLDPADALLPVQADADTDLVDEEKIVHLLKTDREIAVLCLGAVQYYSGQLFDIARLTKIAHENGVVALFDLAHAAGNVPLHLHEWGVDAACFCTYKYLNSGPGCIGGFFVHEQHLATMGLLGGGNVIGSDERHPLNREWSREVGTKRLAGWWSHDKSSRFEMKHQLHPARGAKAFSLSNPAPFRVITPREPWRRGAMLTIKFTDGTLCQQLHARIEKRGVVVDYRKPDALRIAPAPLYNTFEDLAKLFVILDEELAAFCSATTTSGVRPEAEEE